MPNIVVFMVVKDVSKKQSLFEEVVAQASKISDCFYVVDHGSTDGTDRMIHMFADQHAFSVELIHEPHAAGNMDEMKGKHYRILGARAKSGSGRPFVLLLDWDEVMSDALIWEIAEQTLTEDVYLLNRQTFFLGKVIDRGTFLPLLFRPEWLEVWAFKKVHDLYRIHSKKVRKLINPVFHYSFENVREAIDKTRFYAEIEGKELFASRPNSYKCFIGFQLLWKAGLYFVHSLIKYRNFLHVEGWAYASWIFSSYLMQYMYYLEASNTSKTPKN